MSMFLCEEISINYNTQNTVTFYVLKKVTHYLLDLFYQK